MLEKYELGLDWTTIKELKSNEKQLNAIKISLAICSFSSSAYRDWETDRKSTRLNSSHSAKSRMPSSA